MHRESSIGIAEISGVNATIRDGASFKLQLDYEGLGNNSEPTEGDLYLLDLVLCFGEERQVFRCPDAVPHALLPGFKQELAQADDEDADDGEYWSTTEDISDFGPRYRKVCAKRATDLAKRARLEIEFFHESSREILYREWYDNDDATDYPSHCRFRLTIDDFVVEVWASYRQVKRIILFDWDNGEKGFADEFYPSMDEEFDW